MTDISFQLPADLAADISTRAGKIGMTPSTFIASRLPLWLEGEDLLDDFTNVVASLNRTIDEETSQ